MKLHIKFHILCRNEKKRTHRTHPKNGLFLYFVCQMNYVYILTIYLYCLNSSATNNNFYPLPKRERNGRARLLSIYYVSKVPCYLSIANLVSLSLSPGQQFVVTIPIYSTPNEAYVQGQLNYICHLYFHSSPLPSPLLCGSQRSACVCV